MSTPVEDRVHHQTDLPAMLLQMEWAHEVIKAQDKWGMAVFGIIGTGLAASLLSLAPPSALGFDASAAANQLMGQISEVMLNKFPNMPDGALAGLTPQLIRAALIVILACVGGAISKCSQKGLRSSVTHRLLMSCESTGCWLCLVLRALVLLYPAP